jgi:type II secretory pathway component PulF
MARRKRLAAAGGVTDEGGGALSPFAAMLRRAQAADGVTSSWSRFGRGSRKLRPHEFTFILRNLATLVGNGVPLPRALATLAQEDTLARHREVLDALRRKVETGAPLSTALLDVPGVCDRLTASQIRIGERAGALAEALSQLAQRREKSREIRSQIIKKIAYPAMLVVLGSGLIAFLLLYVVPVFEQTYAEAHVPLPFVTQVLIWAGALARQYFLAALGVGALGVLVLVQVRRNESIAAPMDQMLLRMPMFGRWFRDIAVLQLMDALNTLMTSGFTLAEALRQTAESADNRAMRRGVRSLVTAVERGERFSREIERHPDLFPPIVNQLVVVGESTGQLAKATTDICEHLRREIDRKTTLMVGALEPILTISLASAIAVILLAIYLPMFDMVNAVAN